MSVQIILKYGNGEPAPNQLAQGEIGVDLSGKSLWTYSQNLDKNIQLSGGPVDIDQLPDIDIGGGQFITIEELALLVLENQTDISELEGKVKQNETDISENDTAIKGNTSKIENHEGRIAALETWQTNTIPVLNNIIGELGRLDGKIDANTDLITANAGEIEDIWDEIGLIEAGLIFAGGYNANASQIASVSTYAANLGVTVGERLSDCVGEKYKGLYFIVTTDGTISDITVPDNKEAFSGDWLVCDGTKYILLNYALETVSFSQILGSPDDNVALKAALGEKISRENDVVDGGTYSPVTPFMGREQ